MNSRKSAADPLPRAGGRITLRRLAPADLSGFQAYRHDAVLGRYQGWSPLSDAEALAFIREMRHAPLFHPGAWCQIGIALRDADELIGDIGLCLAESQDHVEIGFTVRHKSQGRGLATEAVREAIALVFEHSSVRQVMAVTDARNQASIRLMERVGMKLSQTQAAMFKGEPCTEHSFVAQRPER